MKTTDIQHIVSFIEMKDTFCFPETPVKRSTLSQEAIDFCLKHGILEERGKRLYRAIFTVLPLLDKLPAECLWLLVKPMLTRDVMGYDIITDTRWRKLAIPPQDHAHASKNALEYMEKVLTRLHLASYITFKHIDDVWEITPYRQR